MSDEPTRPLSLTKFADRLVLPRVLRPAPIHPGAYGALRVHLRPARIRLHSALPPTDVCAYEGSRDLRPELVRPAVDRLSRGGSRRPVRRGLGKGSSHGSPTHSVDARSRLPRLCRLERP
jgi:hypothetical protein